MAADIVASTASPSESIVTMTLASWTASAGVAAMVAPAGSSARAVASVRFQARTGRPARSMLRPIPAPMIPVPSRATGCRADGRCAGP